jgi:hypothetical protein
MLIRSPLLFVCGNACEKSSRSIEVHRSESTYFLYAVMHVKKIVEADRYVDWEPLALMLTRWHVDHVCIRGLAPCVNRDHAYDRAKHHRTSVCTEMFVILRGL